MLSLANCLEGKISTGRALFSNVDSKDIIKLKQVNISQIESTLDK